MGSGVDCTPRLRHGIRDSRLLLQPRGGCAAAPGRVLTVANEIGRAKGVGLVHSVIVALSVHGRIGVGILCRGWANLDPAWTASLVPVGLWPPI